MPKTPLRPAREVAKSDRNPSGVNGAVGSTGSFARAWEENNGPPFNCDPGRSRMSNMKTRIAEELRQPDQPGLCRTSAWALRYPDTPFMTKLSPTLQAMTGRLWHKRRMDAGEIAGLLTRRSSSPAGASDLGGGRGSPSFGPVARADVAWQRIRRRSSPQQPPQLLLPRVRSTWSSTQTWQIRISNSIYQNAWLSTRSRRRREGARGSVGLTPGCPRTPGEGSCPLSLRSERADRVEFRRLGPVAALRRQRHTAHNLRGSSRCRLSRSRPRRRVRDSHIQTPLASGHFLCEAGI